MEIIGWLWWFTSGLLALVFSLVWFLISGWIATLAQIGIVAVLIFSYKYGWRRAPGELLVRVGGLVRRVLGWARVREGGGASGTGCKREKVQVVQRRRPGDVNVSTLLNVLMLAGLGAAALL
jgi:hypothetical protein